MLALEAAAATAAQNSPKQATSTCSHKRFAHARIEMHDSSRLLSRLVGRWVGLCTDFQDDLAIEPSVLIETVGTSLSLIIFVSGLR
jgi:hypothetical protein